VIYEGILLTDTLSTSADNKKLQTKQTEQEKRNKRDNQRRTNP